MERRAVLHIGPMKTGSTAIQDWLVRSSAALLAQGYFVPRAMGENMSRLAPIAEARTLGLEPTAIDIERFAALKAELDALPAEVHTILVSAEMLGQQLRTPDQLRFVKAVFDPYVATYDVYAYLRRQDELSLSRYSTALRVGARRARPLSNLFDFDAMLTLWADVFGAATIHPRLYDKASLQGGDVVRDFAAAAGIPFDESYEGSTQVNPSLRPEAQAFLALWAAKVRENGYERPFETVAGHSAANRVLSTRYAGPGQLPSRAEVLAFYSRIAESNERVRARWFPERPALFSDDFSRYPEAPMAPVPAEAVLDVALEVLSQLVTAPTALDVRPKVQADPDRRVLEEQLRTERKARKAGEGRMGQGGGRRRLRQLNAASD